MSCLALKSVQRQSSSFYQPTCIWRLCCIWWLLYNLKEAWIPRRPSWYGLYFGTKRSYMVYTVICYQICTHCSSATKALLWFCSVSLHWPSRNMARPMIRMIYATHHAMPRSSCQPNATDTARSSSTYIIPQHLSKPPIQASILTVGPAACGVGSDAAAWWSHAS